MKLDNNFNSVSYDRSLALLNALMKESKSKQLLNEEADIFPKSCWELFGQSFWYK